MSIMSILNQIKEGSIVLPAIQRNFVWDEAKIEILLDSIMRSYPVGIVLLWETYDDIQYREFVKHFKTDIKYSFSDNSVKRKLKVVLDGQQRLQSLFIALFGTLEGQYLYFDLLSGSDTDDSSSQRYLFRFFKPEEAKEINDDTLKKFKESGVEHGDHTTLPWLIKVQDLYSLDATEKRKLRKKVCEKLNLQDEAEQLIETNLSRFVEVLTKDVNILKMSVIDEELPSESPMRKSESDVLEIFVRINRQGTPLNRSDLIFSMLKLKWQESAEALPDFVDKINKGNSFNLDTDFVIRCLYAVSDLGTKFDIDLLRKKSNMEKIKNNFFYCCQAIESAVDFVQQHCWCSNVKVLGGTNALVPFVYYLFYLPKHQIPKEDIVNVRKSLYVFGFTSPFSRYGDSRLAKFIREELKPLKDKEVYFFPVKKAFWWASWWTGINEYGERLIQMNPRLALQVVQRQQGAKAHYSPNSNEIDHIFPRVALRTKGHDEGKVNHYANFWLLSKGKNGNKSNKHPQKYFEDVPDSELKNAHIDRDMLDYRKYDTFLKARGSAILRQLQDVIGITDDDFE